MEGGREGAREGGREVRAREEREKREEGEKGEEREREEGYIGIYLYTRKVVNLVRERR